jgi:hypothetical protein
MPNVMGFSLYYRGLWSGAAHMSIVENTLFKAGGGSWFEWWQDLKDKRDMSKYLKGRWYHL